MTTLKTACGNEITLTDDTHRHLLTHPEAAELLEEAVAKVELPESGFLLTTVYMGRVVGNNVCVKAENVDTLHFAVRPGREFPSRVLPGQEPEPTSLFTVIAGRQEDGSWLLYTGFAGPSAPREPTDPHFADKRDSDEFREAVEFWTENGLCMGDGCGEPFVSTWDKVLAEVDAKRAEVQE
jgi:hypothetical protein